MTLKSKIEALLFYKAEPMSITYLVKILNVSGLNINEVDARNALVELEEDLSTGGIRIIFKDDTVILGTAPELSDLIEGLAKEELNKNLGRAGLETLTIILYKGPVSKSEIDYIRGVNSGYILRNLLIRGLIERKTNPSDKRTFIYSSSIDLMKHLGIMKIEDLPEYASVSLEIDNFEEDFKEKEDDEEDESEK